MGRSRITIEETKTKIKPFAGPATSPTSSLRKPPSSGLLSLPRKPIAQSAAEPELTSERVEVELLELEPVNIIEKSTIKLDREIYSRRGFNQVVGIEFEEFQRKEDTFSPDQFFQLYNSLFFEIPKTGQNSHTSIARRSREYVKGISTVDPKDSVIDSLNDKIIELEQELLLANQTDPEHPFFKNGTLLAESVNGTRTGKFFYMDKGYKREVDYNPTFYGTLLKVLGYTTGTDYPDASRNMLSQIKTGPNLSESNFEQPTYIENGELLVGTNVEDNTKDAVINRLRSEVSSLNQRVEDLQELLEEATTGPINQGGGVDTGGAFNGEPTFNGQFGPNFNNPFN